LLGISTSLHPLPQLTSFWEKNNKNLLPDNQFLFPELWSKLRNIGSDESILLFIASLLCTLIFSKEIVRNIEQLKCYFTSAQQKISLPNPLISTPSHSICIPSNSSPNSYPTFLILGMYSEISQPEKIRILYNIGIKKEICGVQDFMAKLHQKSLVSGCNFQIPEKIRFQYSTFDTLQIFFCEFLANCGHRGRWRCWDSYPDSQIPGQMQQLPRAPLAIITDIWKY